MRVAALMTETHTAEWRTSEANVRDNVIDKYQDKLLIRGITEADKKDLVHWMAYREKRPPSPTPDSILEKMKSSNKESDGTKIDRFVERECTEKLFILNM